MKRNIIGILAITALSISVAVAKTQATFKPGTKVEVAVNGKWIPASILSYNGAKYKIHFTGWSKSKDGYAGPERIRAVRFASPKACN